MPRTGRLLVATTVFCLVALTAGFVLFRSSTDDDYHLQLIMPSAAGLFAGTPVQINGQDAGTVTSLSTRDGKAVAHVSIDAKYAPIRAGVQPQVLFRSVLGENYISLKLGKASNPALPSGAMVTTGWSEVTVENLLEALDPATRAKVASLVGQLDKTLAGRQPDLNATLKSAGPAVAALGDVLGAIGKDGPAIRTLVTTVHQVSRQIASRQDRLSATVQNLDALTTAAATQQQDLTDSLTQLPATLTVARNTLAKVPAVTAATVPLLKDLVPATAKLTPVAANLAPVLKDLRPTVASLKPTLRAAAVLLRYTPALLADTHSVLPGLTTTVGALGPALQFLRPYTPDLMGWLSNWNSAFSRYDLGGHFGGALAVASASAFNANPGVLPPGLTADYTPAPGKSANQPWLDANGDTER